MPPRPIRFTRPWQRALEEPIALPRGRALITLADCGRHMLALRKAEQATPHWQTAAACVLGAAEGREPLLHARIAMLKAINHGKPPPAPAPRARRAKAFRIIR